MHLNWDAKNVLHCHWCLLSAQRALTCLRNSLCSLLTSTFVLPGLKLLQPRVMCQIVICFTNTYWVAWPQWLFLVLAIRKDGTYRKDELVGTERSCTGGYRGENIGAGCAHQLMLAPKPLSVTWIQPFCMPS